MFSFMHNLYLFALIIIFIHCEDKEIIFKKLQSLKCTQDFCKKVVCEEIYCSGGVLIPNGSFCQCCDICVKISFRGINDSCDEGLSRSFGLIAKKKCKQGLKCENGMCVWDKNNLESCLYQRCVIEQTEGMDNYKDILWKPECDSEGNYVPKQQKERKSICVAETGKKIFGTGRNKESSCECSRYMQKKQMETPHLYYIKTQEHCSPSGNFQSLQCINDLCYCANETTGQVTGKMVRTQFIDKLPCFDNTNTETNYIQNCERELIRSRSLAYELSLKGVKLLGNEQVACDPDGTYSAMQCDAKWCYCTNSEGVGIESNYIESEQFTILNVNMACHCARDEKGTRSLSQLRGNIKCDKYGNYQSFQCFGGQCKCMDEDGNSISKSSNITYEDCIKLLKNLKILPKDDSDDDKDPDDDYDLDY